MSTRLPRGVRLNNPGNVRYVEGITSTYQGCIGSDGAFCRFDTPHNGLRALCKLLLVYQDRHGLRTVRGIINRWAPPVENDTSAYVVAVAQQLDVGPDVELDLRREGTLASLAIAIVQHENGQQPYEVDRVLAAAGDALGLVHEVHADPPAIELEPDTQAAGPLPDPAPEPQQETPMPLPLIAIASAISTWGPTIAALIPQVATLFDHDKQTPAKIEAAQVVVNKIVETTGAVNTEAAIAAVTSNPEMLEKVRAAVITAPEILPYVVVEVGGGFSAAREANKAAILAGTPLWQDRAFVITLIPSVFPLLLLVDFLFVHADLYKGDIRTQIVTGVLGVIFVVSGYWLGGSIGSARKTDIIAAQAPQGVTK